MSCTCHINPLNRVGTLHILAFHELLLKVTNILICLRQSLQFPLLEMQDFGYGTQLELRTYILWEHTEVIFLPALVWYLGVGLHTARPIKIQIQYSIIIIVYYTTSTIDVTNIVVLNLETKWKEIIAYQHIRAPTNILNKIKLIWSLKCSLK